MKCMWYSNYWLLTVIMMARCVVIEDPNVIVDGTSVQGLGLPGQTAV